MNNGCVNASGGVSLGISTNWNSQAHADGDSLVEDIRALGFRDIECGYQLRDFHLAGIRKQVEQGVISVCSLHAFAPLPAGAMDSGPESASPSAPLEWRRQEAVVGILRALDAAVMLAAPSVVIHAGRVGMHPLSPGLMTLARHQLQESRRFQWRLNRLLNRREKIAPAHFDALCRSLDRLLPEFEAQKVSLCLEILPEWESLPTETEWFQLKTRYPTPALRYWHDFGHYHIRETLGFGYQRAWLERVLPHCAGAHLHTNDGTSDTHALPPAGSIRFVDFAFLANASIPIILEPAPGTPRYAVQTAAASLMQLWHAR